MTYKYFLKVARTLSDSYGGCLSAQEIREYADVYMSEYRFHGGDVSKSEILTAVLAEYEEVMA